MIDWKARLKILEDDLSKKDPRPSISAYHDMPYAIFHYPPEKEFALRAELEHLCARLENRGKRLTIISLAECLDEALKAAGMNIKEVEEVERIGHGKLLETIHEVLSSYRPLEDLVEERLPSSQEPERDIVLITRAGALFPVYRTSALLDQLQGKVLVPAILFYPGLHTEAAGLSFMGVMPADGTYRARIY